MAGGQGTRLWPKSRVKTPKQLHALVGEKSLVQETFGRLSLITEKDKIIISTTPEYAAEMKKHLPEVPANNFIIEPYPMNTAAACGLVSKILNLRDPESIVAFFPSDHNIKNPAQFAETLKYAEKICNKHPEHILTIGIQPTKADTGLGYIHMGAEIDHSGNFIARKVQRFVEKPDQVTADQYLASGEYLWNAGMFVWKTKYLLQLMKKDLPKSSAVFDLIGARYGKNDYSKVLKKHFKEADNISIDYGIMEKNKDILVIPGDFGWSDIGSWGTLLDVVCDLNGSDVVCRGNHIGVGNSNVLVMAGDKLVATVGLSNIIVVDTPDVLLICNGKEDQKIKEILTKLKDENKVEYL